MHVGWFVGLLSEAHYCQDLGVIRQGGLVSSTVISRVLCRQPPPQRRSEPHRYGYSVFLNVAPIINCLSQRPTWLKYQLLCIWTVFYFSYRGPRQNLKLDPTLLLKRQFCTNMQTQSKTKSKEEKDFLPKYAVTNTNTQTPTQIRRHIHRHSSLIWDGGWARQRKLDVRLIEVKKLWSIFSPNIFHMIAFRPMRNSLFAFSPQLSIILNSSDNWLYNRQWIGRVGIETLSLAWVSYSNQ